MRQEMSKQTMNIGTVSKKSGVPAGTIRYYESVGYLPPARRNRSGFRIYTVVDVDTLTFIKSARDLGFSIKDVHELLALSRKEDQTRDILKAKVERHAAAFERKIDDLNAMRRAILALVENCQSGCRPDHPCLDNETHSEAP